MDTSEIKDIYNRKVKGKFQGDYEHRRWFASDILKAGYEMTLKSLRYHLLEKSPVFQDFLELGPGAGTWTKLFLEKQPQANFDLVDISSEMLALAKENLSFHQNIKYFEADFLGFEGSKKYDLFFSSRVIEYFSNKEALIKKIQYFLKDEGEGFIITKTPKYWRSKLTGKEIDNIHQGQIAPATLGVLLKKNNFSNTEFYPVTMVFPFFGSTKLNKWLHRIFYKKRLNFLSRFFSESYCVKFSK
ncbi:MAG: class I SAM-dependent methyltransferase [Candidatus Portnoybacteria bacterium]|nr:class I SAM-dependent methyltransferase [Candidatus Portnoybacteria bacterium]